MTFMIPNPLRLSDLLFAGVQLGDGGYGADFDRPVVAVPDDQRGGRKDRRKMCRRRRSPLERTVNAL